MLRLKLTLGLLATLIILLLVGIYGVWLFNDLGRAVDEVLRDNYDSIKVCHYMRTATARVNTFYTRGERPYPPLDQPQTLDEVEQQFKARFPILERTERTDPGGQKPGRQTQRCLRALRPGLPTNFSVFQRRRLK